MSITSKTENAFKGVLVARGVALTIHVSQQNQSIVKSGTARVSIRALGGAQVTPRARNIRMLVAVSVETSADKDQGAETNPEDDHDTNVDIVHAALDNSPIGLAAMLSDPALDIGAFTCFGSLPQGELGESPKPEERIFRDTWSYICTVCESSST